LYRTWEEPKRSVRTIVTSPLRNDIIDEYFTINEYELPPVKVVKTKVKKHVETFIEDSVIDIDDSSVYDKPTKVSSNTKSLENKDWVVID